MRISKAQLISEEKRGWWLWRGGSLFRTIKINRRNLFQKAFNQIRYNFFDTLIKKLRISKAQLISEEKRGWWLWGRVSSYTN